MLVGEMGNWNIKAMTCYKQCMAKTCIIEKLWMHINISWAGRGKIMAYVLSYR
jgi:hypothetical protein